MSQPNNKNNSGKKESDINIKKSKPFNSTPLPKKNKSINNTSNGKNNPLNLKKKENNKSQINSLEYLVKISMSEQKRKPKKNINKNKKTKELLLGAKHASITAYEKEYEKLNNLCNNKKNNRSKEEISQFIKKQREQLLKEKRDKKKQRTSKNLKIFISFEKLQRKIQKQKLQIKSKTPLINRFLKKSTIKAEDEDSKGSILTTNDMKKEFYIKCIDTMRIYAPREGFRGKKPILNRNSNEANNAKLLLFNDKQENKTSCKTIQENKI